jgi:hypothetical protein
LVRKLEEHNTTLQRLADLVGESYRERTSSLEFTKAAVVMRWDLASAESAIKSASGESAINMIPHPSFIEPLPINDVFNIPEVVLGRVAREIVEPRHFRPGGKYRGT